MKLALRTTRPVCAALATSTRGFHSSLRMLAKGDSSTIDAYKLPSQTSINEWEFKYDFIPKVALPKIPPVTPEAVKQDIAQTKRQQVEAELFNRELTSLIKVEANDASVVHGGESVGAEVELLQDRGLDPVDASFKGATGGATKKTANHDQYVHTSANPDINNPEVVNLGHENDVDHKIAAVHEAKVVDDVEHDEAASTSAPEAESGSGNAVKVLGVLGLGGLAGYFWLGNPKKK